MTGPHFLTAVTYDEHYNDPTQMMFDAAKLLNNNFKRLAAGGMQAHPDRRAIFDPAERRRSAHAVEAINLSIEKLPKDIHVAVHVCQGNYAVGPHYDGQIGHRYFDTGRYKADLICQIECDSYLIEHDRTDLFDGILGNKQLGVGAVDVQAPNIEIPASRSPNESPPIRGLPPSRRSSRARAGSIIFPGTSRSEKCGR